MKIHHAPQNSEEWFAIKKGRPSASNFDKIITAVKGDLSKQCTGYIRSLIGECFCPSYASFLGNKWTDRGMEMEPQARDAFSAHTGLKLEQVGFCTREDELVGCSPDSLIVDENGKYIAGLEIKCPSPAVHIEYVLEGVLPDTYKQQVHGSMAVTGLDRWHFWSFFEGMQPLHVIVERSEYTEKVSAALDEFIIMYGKAYAEAMPLLILTPPSA